MLVLLSRQMRRVTKSEQEKAEIEASERTDRRNLGFGLMGTRDKGQFTLSNDIVMRWHSDREWMFDGKIVINGEEVEFQQGNPNFNIPDGKFLLKFKNEEVLFDKEEFMRYLRWV